jgi:hypothetical protein
MQNNLFIIDVVCHLADNNRSKRSFVHSLAAVHGA